LYYPEPWSGTYGTLAELSLPALALGFYTSGQITRITRAAMLDVLQQDYIRTALAKGLQSRVVVLRHALRNALVPVTSILGPTVIEYLVGTVAREQVGLGRDALRRLRRNKLALVAGVYLVLLAVVCVISLFWTPYKPNAIGTCQTYELPSASHPLGCDDLGRD